MAVIAAKQVALKAPFPYFGGKARVAGEVWARFGLVRNYIEPFAGSLAVLLGRPLPFDGVETVNDKDGLLANFWRAVQAEPDLVAHYADWPVNENDFHARHAWLVEQKETLLPRLEGGTDYYDAKVAGYWVWGICCWIGGGFCSGNGPWRVVEIDGTRQLVHLSNAGQGVNRKRVHLSDAGQGVNRKRVHLGNAGMGEQGLLAWMQALAARLRRVRVCSGDWKRVCGGRSGNALRHFFAGGQLCGIFLDPPYSAEANRDGTLYRCEDLSVAHAVRDWAIAHGGDPRLRICLCGYEGEHAMPDNWTAVPWKAHGGMAAVGGKKDARGKKNRFRERLWFSPHCLRREEAVA